MAPPDGLLREHHEPRKPSPLAEALEAAQRQLEAQRELQAQTLREWLDSDARAAMAARTAADVAARQAQEAEVRAAWGEYNDPLAAAPEDASEPRAPTDIDLLFLARLPAEHRQRVLSNARSDARWTGSMPSLAELDLALNTPSAFERRGCADYPSFREFLNGEDYRFGAWQAARARTAPYAALAAAVKAEAAALREALDAAGVPLDLMFLANADDDEIRAEGKRTAEARLAAYAAQQEGRRQRGAAPLEWTPEVRKQIDAAWQTGQLRRRVTKTGLLIAACLRTVGGRNGAAYVDAHTEGRFHERQERAREMAGRRWFLSDAGDRVRLLDIMDAQAAATLSRLYAQLLGMQTLAERRGLSAVFLTLTLPPRYHPNPTQGRRSWTSAVGIEAGKKALQNDWRRFLRRLDKHEIDVVFGAAFKEPHKDGTPHLHALVWVAPEHVDDVIRILGETAPGRHRTDAKVIDPNYQGPRGPAKPITYLMKYLIKSVNDGAKAAELAGGAGDDEDDGDHLTNHAAVRAWASAYGLRRWSLLGVHGVQRLWQTIFMWKEVPDDAPEAARNAWVHMHKGEWAEALLTMGAVRGEENFGCLHLTYEDFETRFGEVARRPVGMAGTDGRACPLSTKAWTVVDESELPPEEKKADDKKSHENNVVALDDSCPRAPSAPPAPGEAVDGETPLERVKRWNREARERRKPAPDASESLLPLLRHRENDPKWSDWTARARQILAEQGIGAAGMRPEPAPVAVATPAPAGHRPRRAFIADLIALGEDAWAD